MVERYFEKFPTITYANNQVKDILERVVFSRITKNDPYIYYPFDLNYNERADQFAHRYYDDSFYSWLLYLTNDVTDPYYDWYMEPDEFNEYIRRKYGDVGLAHSKTKFYRNNWPNDEPISVSRFNSLPESLTKYWEPQLGVSGNITGYKRREDDTIVSTNYIRAYTVSNTSFSNDEIVNIHFSVNYTGQGQFKFATGNTVYLQHTSGTTLANGVVTITGSSYLYGTESTVNTVFTTAAAYANNLSDEEAVYFSPVTYYDYENEKNERNKSIQVLDSDYAKEVAVKLKDKLNGKQ